MSKKSENKSDLKKSFHKSLGILLPLLIIVALAGLTVLSHDYIYANRHTSQADVSNDNRWGGLLVSADILEIENSTGQQGYPSTVQECEPEERAPECRYDSIRDIYVTGASEISASPGYTKITGRVYIKNSYWTRSNKIPVNLIEYRYGENQTVGATIDGYRPGSFLSPRSGTSADFQIDVPVHSPNGKLYINDGDHNTELKF